MFQRMKEAIPIIDKSVCSIFKCFRGRRVVAPSLHTERDIIMQKSYTVNFIKKWKRGTKVLAAQVEHDRSGFTSKLKRFGKENNK